MAQCHAQAAAHVAGAAAVSGEIAGGARCNLVADDASIDHLGACEARFALLH
jgi:hypothetical protein